MAFERAWEGIVEQHGVDWCGFENVRAAYSALHAHSPHPWRSSGAIGAASSSASDAASGAPPHVISGAPPHVISGAPPHVISGGPPHVISVELWDAAHPEELVSAEVGVLVGRAYTCLSLFARTADYPRSDWVRAVASILWLRRAGVELFDVGTTAGYYSELFGFRRCDSRRHFVEQWRKKRACALANPTMLREACSDVRALLVQYQTAPTGGTQAAHARAGPKANERERAARPLKHTVRIDGLQTDGLHADALATALASAIPLSVDRIERVSLVAQLSAAFVTFADASSHEAALALDGCVLPIGAEGARHACQSSDGVGEAPAPIVRVQAHGRKAKRMPPSTSPACADAAAPSTRNGRLATRASQLRLERTRIRTTVGLVPCGPDNVSLSIRVALREATERGQGAGSN